MEEALLQTNYAIDTFYFLILGALVMFMACGFSMLEAGMVRAKNTAEILTKNVALYSIACVMFLLCGYQIMYPEGTVLAGFVPDAFGLGLGAENTVDDVIATAGTEDHAYYSGRSDYFFQVVFVATAMSIVSGAVAERMKLWSFLIFAVFLTGFIYPLQGLWNWGGGILSSQGYFDFAGSGTVHLCGAVAALVGVLFLGARKGKYTPDGRVNALPGCNMPLATLGMFILWLGWFGFNGGSELKLSNVDEANAVAQVFVNTNLAACGGVIAALLLARVWFGKADLTMALNGALGGLVAITADPLSPSATIAVVVGIVAGLLVVPSIVCLDRILKVDDPVGAISVHGTCGILGVLMVAFTNSDVGLGSQITGVLAIILFVGIASAIVWGILAATIGIRVSEEAEDQGVDFSETGIEAYPEFVAAN